LTKLPNLSDRRYFSATMATRSFFIGDYQIGRVSGKGAVNLAYPVLDAADKPEAVVYIALGLGELSGRLIETAILPENSTIAIMDNHGTILVRQPDPEQWVGKSLPDAPLIKAILAAQAGRNHAGTRCRRSGAAICIQTHLFHCSGTDLRQRRHSHRYCVCRRE